MAFPTLDCAQPRWSADAALLAVACGGASEDDGIYLLRLDGTRDPQVVLRRASGKPRIFPVSFSPDASEILVERGTFRENVLLAVPIEGDVAGEARTLLEGAATFSASLSRDGSKLAYMSNETGRWEVFLRRRGDDGGLGPAVPVAPGRGPTWRTGPDGRERLFYVTGDEQIVSTVVGDDLTVSPTRVHHDLSQHRNIVSSELLPDGRVLAALRGEDERLPDRINVILGFDSEVERLVGLGE